ncbi:MAG: glycerol-3-phosphate dehydrogenase subunit GlpB [Tannerellaceae bacterium]|nr:glycerol-3-phosphate dehydrogenase subunit GlpB [Tannerellaceae bacterium]
MKFDTVIIGGGLAGLIGGIRLSQEGQRCVIVSSGQSALHFLSGSFDLLNTLPDGTAVTEPFSALRKLIQMEPDHPYAKLGTTRCEELARQAELFFKQIGIPLKGTSQKNHYRVTPMGALKRTWLTVADFITSEDSKKLPWKEITILNPIGFLDFYPQFIAAEFKKLGTHCTIHSFNLPDLDILRRNPTGMRATHIARILDKQENVKELARIIKEQSGRSDTVILPASIGLSSSDMLRYLEEETGKSICLVPTLPPSIAGIRMQQYLCNYFKQLGGVYMMGDNVTGADMEENRIRRVYSCNHGNIPFEADNYILATGSYFSRGLVAGREKIDEPVFNLDVSYLKDRNEWYTGNIFEPQAYQQFGVTTTLGFEAIRKGRTVENLYVAGVILEGFNPVKEGTGGGVSILTALHIADKIVKEGGR